VVGDVSVIDGRVHRRRSHGDRTAIADVGAALVRAGEVPADLRVEIPELEAALLGLLDDAAVAGGVPASRSPLPSDPLIAVVALALAAAALAARRAAL
jgi:hypothetical protein